MGSCNWPDAPEQTLFARSTDGNGYSRFVCYLPGAFQALLWVLPNFYFIPAELSVMVDTIMVCSDKTAASISGRGYRRRRKKCLSCGTARNMQRNRRYCSLACRQKLWRQLDVRTGLLRALNTRYASFCFTEALLVLDVLPYDMDTIFSFIYPRSPGAVPATDFAAMSNELGAAWWAEKNRTRKRYLASRHLFERAIESDQTVQSAWPLQIKQPVQVGKLLTCLKLDSTDLRSPDLRKVIKTAYWRAAKQHHPDQGGEAAMFMKIQQAYEHLLKWTENPSFTMQRGIPGKWFYEGYRNKWTQPTAG